MVYEKFAGAGFCDSAMFQFFPVMIYKDVSHDGEQPCADVCAFQVFFPVGQGSEKGFLVKIFCLFGVFGEGKSKGFQEISISDKQGVKFNR